MRSIFPGLLLVLVATGPALSDEFPRFLMEEIDPNIGNICYAVTAADVNGDRKLDVVAVSEDAVIWYENPTWDRHELIRGATARDNVCIQPHDIDGDGRVDFALGAGWRPPDTSRPATLQWLGRDASGAWKLYPISFDEPMIHRLRWGDVKGSGKKQLVVAPLQGRGTKGPDWGRGQGVKVLVYDIPGNPTEKAWPVEIADQSLHSIHNLQLVDYDGDQVDEIVLACWEGVFLLDRSREGQWTKTQLGTGYQEPSARSRGASEVKVGRLAAGFRYIATIEPWHGFQVVMYTRDATAYPNAALVERGPAQRVVIEQPMQWGHAVWCANLDDDADEELIIGQRDPNPLEARVPRGPGVFVFDPRPGTYPPAFVRHPIDDGGVACEDAMAADLDGDGRNDIVAGGRATHNVRIYWNKPLPQPQ
jgi:hypothetical protein